MASKERLVTMLSQLVLIDEETIESQLWPHLLSLATRSDCREYFSTLLGVGEPQAEHFVEAFLQFRFSKAPPPPPPTAPRSAAGFPLPVGSAPAPPKSNWASSGVTRLSKAEEQQQRESREQQDVLRKRIEQENIQKEFGSTGGGRIYQKNRGDDEMYGGKRGKSSQRSSTATASDQSASSSTLPPTALPFLPPVASSSLARSHHSAVRQAISIPPPPSNIVTEEQFATSVKLELEDIDKSLVNFLEGEQGHRGCFCQARDHPLSPFIPLCRRCSIPLCDLNRPSSPCPSCQLFPLLSPTLISSFVSQLQEKRDRIVAQEQARITRLRDEREQKKREEVFPGLEDEAHFAAGVRTIKGRGYSNIAGGGMDTVATPSLGAPISSSAPNTINGRKILTRDRGDDAKVLRLVGKKVKVVTKVKVAAKPIAKPVTATKSTPSAAPQESTASSIVTTATSSSVVLTTSSSTPSPVAPPPTEEDDDRYQDPHDDGLSSHKSALSSPIFSAARSKARPFQNFTLDDSLRPKWVELRLAEEMVGPEKENFDIDAMRAAIPGVVAGDSTAANPSTSNPSLQVPGGSATAKEGDAKKRGRPKVKKAAKGAPLTSV